MAGYYVAKEYVCAVWMAAAVDQVVGRIGVSTGSSVNSQLKGWGRTVGQKKKNIGVKRGGAGRARGGSRRL